MKYIPAKHLKDTVLSKLLEIPDKPQGLYVQGDISSFSGLSLITIVGSRTCSSYAKEITKRLISELAGYPVCIVSGLALGIDGIAHNSALDAGIKTIAFPGSGLDPSVLYPASHKRLADCIMHNDGLLVSELKPKEKAARWTFPKRNRLMAAVSNLVIIVEAREKSGTLITARLATEYNTTIAVVPQNINHPHAYGSNKLMREGAYPILDYRDILALLNIPINSEVIEPLQLNSEETIIYDLLVEPQPKSELHINSGLPYQDFINTFSILEIKGVLIERYGKVMRASSK